MSADGHYWENCGVGESGCTCARGGYVVKGPGHRDKQPGEPRYTLLPTGPLLRVAVQYTRCYGVRLLRNPV